MGSDCDEVESGKLGSDCNELECRKSGEARDIVSWRRARYGEEIRKVSIMKLSCDSGACRRKMKKYAPPVWKQRGMQNKKKRGILCILNVMK